MIKTSIACLFTIITFTTAFAQNKTSEYEAFAGSWFDTLNNKPFLPLQLEDTASHIFNTASLTGKTIYADLWFTTCSPCIKEIPYSRSLQQFFAPDTTIAFLSICIDNKERKQAWKKMIHDKQMPGIHLFYVRNHPQTINLIKEYKVTFPMYLLINKQMKIIGYDAPRPSEKGWVHWAIAEAANNKLLSDSYRQLIHHSKNYSEFINTNWQSIEASSP